MDVRPDADLQREIIERVAAVEAAGSDLARAVELDDVEVVLRLGLISYATAVLRRAQKRLIRETKARGIDAELVLAVSDDRLRMARLEPVPWPDPHTPRDGP